MFSQNPFAEVSASIPSSFMQTFVVVMAILVAEASYQIVPDLGIFFSRTPAVFREAIAGFVERTLSSDV